VIHPILTPPDSGESFRLADNCEGVIWHDAAGWSGCLKWDIEGNTDFVGPFDKRSAAIDAVMDAHQQSSKEQS
jgi:hypothetical protein